MDALLCEAGYCTEGYMESAQLKNVSYTPAGSDYSAIRNFRLKLASIPRKREPLIS